MRINKLLVTASAVTSIAFFACKHEVPALPVVIQNPPGTPPASTVVTTVSCGGNVNYLLCFQSEILPLFQKNCATSGCHDAVSQKAGYILDSYDNLFKKDGKYTNNNIRQYKPGNSDLYTILFKTGSKKMPPNSDLSADQKNLIAQWVNQGAFNSVCTNTPTCDSNQFKFSANILPLLQKNCTGCHGGVSPESGIRLTTYDSVKSVTSLLYGVVAHLPGYNAMPKCPDPANPILVRKLSDCEIAQIRKWIQAGALNN